LCRSCGQGPDAALHQQAANVLDTARRQAEAAEAAAARAAAARAAAAAAAAAEAAPLIGFSPCPPGPIFSRDLPNSSAVSISCASASDDLCVTLQASDKPHRNPIHCIVVLDVSGSMDSQATQDVPTASQESKVSFTRLDLAKHSSKVIVEVMGDDDCVTLVSFSSEAKLIMPKTCMNASGEVVLRSYDLNALVTLYTGKLEAKAAIENLQTEGSTNLIAANKLALSLALNDVDCNNIHIVVLTDGEPDSAAKVLPQFYHEIAPLDEARAGGRHHGVCVSTFGFGYEMNSVRNTANLA
jgi:Mg-chelatase subunit ChlD